MSELLQVLGLSVAALWIVVGVMAGFVGFGHLFMAAMRKDVLFLVTGMLYVLAAVGAFVVASAQAQP